MTISYKDIPVNPFEDDFVKEPRDVSFSVKGLNDAPLRALLDTFARLETGPVPRKPVGAAKVQLVVSPDRGYGKSHLLGRLFTRLGARATKVYLRPFEDPYKAWHSILQAAVDELRTSEAGGGGASQLRGLAVAVLARLASDLIGVYGVPGSLESPDKVIAMLRGTGGAPALPEAHLRRWIEWLMVQLSEPEHGARLVSNLHDQGVDLHQREKAWLKVLAAQVLDASRGPRAWAATKWLRAEPLEPAEAALLGIDEADNDGRGDCSPQELNGLSFQRLRGLCLLGSYHRPFLFCFDQTEAYAGDRPLIRALGGCLEKGCVELKNQLTVITANHNYWAKETAPLMTTPHLDRLSPEILLEGIGEDGARELITARLDQCGLDRGEIPRFFSTDWLNKIFAAIPRHGVRDVLRKSRDRFQELAKILAPPAPSLAELFQLEVNNIRSKRALMLYNQDALMWFVKEVGKGQPDVSVEWAPNHKYFSFVWRWSERQVAFAFEGGTHWRKWQAIAREASRLSHESPDAATLSYVLRTPDLEKIPKPSWRQAKPDIVEARSNGFRVIVLTLDKVCEIHAARELHSSALQGNIDYPAEDTLRWLQAHFAPLLQGLAQRQVPEVQTETGDSPQPSVAEPAPPEPPALTRELDANGIRIVTDTVREHKIVDINTVLGRLKGAGPQDPELRDALLRSVEQHPNLKAHAGPNTIYLQWRNTPSPPAS